MSSLDMYLFRSFIYFKLVSFYLQGCKDLLYGLDTSPLEDNDIKISSCVIGYSFILLTSFEIELLKIFARIEFIFSFVLKLWFRSKKPLPKSRSHQLMPMFVFSEFDPCIFYIWAFVFFDSCYLLYII